MAPWCRGCGGGRFVGASAWLLAAGCQVNPAFDVVTGGGGGASDASDGPTLAGSEASGGAASPTGGGTGGADEAGAETAVEGSTGAGEATAGTTGPASAACGNGVVEPGEACDDGNAAADDGCVACVTPRSCAEILELAPMSPSGTYAVDPNGDGAPWPVVCDMELDGGGWTGFAVQDTCDGRLVGTITALEPAELAGVDGECRPYSEKKGPGMYAYTWDIRFPPGFAAFFLRGYEVQGLGDVELKFPQVTWQQAYAFPNGALSIGDAHEAGPLANWAKDGGMLESFFDGQILPWPLQDVPYVLAGPTDTLRIGWGEIGENPEGLYPWWSGRIFVR